MYLSNIRLINVKGFDDVEINFTDEDGNVRLWNCFFGENGFGKTTLLQCISTQLIPSHFCSTLNEDTENWIQKNSKRSIILSSKTSIIHPKESVKNLTIILDQFISSEVPSFEIIKEIYDKKIFPFFNNALSSKNILNYYENSLIVSEDYHVYRFYAGYGPFRRLTGGSLDAEKILEKENFASSFITLFREDAALTNVKQWLVDLYNTGRDGDEANQKKLKIVSEIIESKLFPERTKLYVNATSAMIEMVDMDGLKLPIQALSDGYRSMLALVVDMVRWAMKANPEAENPLLEPGVVLIDELDAHLHPKWQQRIGVWLRETFPNVQFIIATHSPFLAQVYPEGNHILYRDEETGRIEVKKGASEAADWRIDQVLTGIFDLPSTRSLEFERKRKELDALRQKHFEGSLQEDEARRLGELEAWSKKVPHLEGSMQRLADHFDHILKNKLAAQKPPVP